MNRELVEEATARVVVELTNTKEQTAGVEPRHLRREIDLHLTLALGTLTAQGRFKAPEPAGEREKRIAEARQTANRARELADRIGAAETRRAVLSSVNGALADLALLQGESPARAGIDPPELIGKEYEGKPAPEPETGLETTLVRSEEGQWVGVGVADWLRERGMIGSWGHPPGWWYVNHLEFEDPTGEPWTRRLRAATEVKDGGVGTPDHLLVLAGRWMTTHRPAVDNPATIGAVL